MFCVETTLPVDSDKVTKLLDALEKQYHLQLQAQSLNPNSSNNLELVISREVTGDPTGLAAKLEEFARKAGFSRERWSIAVYQSPDEPTE
jgi:hypothetical protein